MLAPYPAHLQVGVACFNRECDILFMDSLIAMLQRLKTSVYFKPNHSCVYVPWNSKIPQHVKNGTD